MLNIIELNEDLKRGRWRIRVRICGSFIDFEIDSIAKTIDNEAICIYLKDAIRGCIWLMDTDKLKRHAYGYYDIVSWSDYTEIWLLKE